MNDYLGDVIIKAFYFEKVVFKKFLLKLKKYLKR